LALRSVADGALFAEVFGEGPPRILALHGWGRRGSDFRRSLHGLPALALDLPGFGASPMPEGVIGAEGYAEIVAAALGEFDGPPVLVGHSFGGRVAVALAARNPERVGPMVLTGVPVVRNSRAGGPALGYRVVRFLNRVGVVSEERLERERRKRGSADYRAASGLMRGILVKVINESYEEELAAIPNRITFLWGAEDSEVPVGVADRAIAIRESAGLISEREVLEGIGHHVPLEAPDELRRVVEGLLG
jgi:pimeloyl-ACP methyl ester carboxylesterase